MGEVAINRFINSRVLTWLTAVVGIVAAYAMLLFFGTPSVPPVEGLFGGGLDHLLPSGILSWAVNMVVVFVAAVMLNWLNKTYVFIREHTMMFVTVFLCATLSNPVVSTSLGTPTLLALALVVCTYVMFGTFQQRDSQSVAFFITMILTVCAMQSFVFALYIPVFIVGFFQMRIFTLRTPNWTLVGAAAASLALTTLCIYVPFLADAFDFTAISAAEYAVAMGLAVLVIPVVELVKCVQRAVEKRAAHA